MRRGNNCFLGQYLGYCFCALSVLLCVTDFPLCSNKTCMTFYFQILKGPLSVRIFTHYSTEMVFKNELLDRRVKDAVSS